MQQVEKTIMPYLKDGMIVGLGSGTTVNKVLEFLAKHIEQGLKIVGVPTSKKTEAKALELKIPIKEINEVERIDLTIDGANEIDDQLNLVKGGGGSLLREKMIAAFSKELIIVAHSSKKKSFLGEVAIPIEVVPYGWEVLARHYIPRLNGKAQRREINNEVFISDNGNYILDCVFQDIQDIQKLHTYLINLVGVVETGLFINMAKKVVLYNDEAVKLIEK